MKKTILFFAFLTATTISGYGQFNDRGYKDLKLGMNYLEAEKVTKIDLAQDDSAQSYYEGIKFELTFNWIDDEHCVYSIKTTNKNAKLEGFKQNIIGKSLKEIKAILGGKLAPYEDAGPGSPYYIYYVNKEARNNYDTSCVLEFNESGVLKSIMAVYNP